MLPLVKIHHLGIISYPDAVAYQEKLFAAIVDRKLGNRKGVEAGLPKNHLLFCEHPPVYTLGKNGDPHHLLLNQQELNENGVTFYQSSRGGDITYHGPGQLVVYPLLDLDQFFTDIHRYMRFLEEAVIQVMAGYGLNCGRLSGHTGVWMGLDTLLPRKICALGVRCSHWVTMHGLALNVCPDLNYFSHIIPCGISDKGVTSMEIELGLKPKMSEIREKLADKLQSLFGWQVDSVLEEKAVTCSATS